LALPDAFVDIKEAIVVAGSQALRRLDSLLRDCTELFAITMPRK
jgi:hypothetical protein